MMLSMNFSFGQKIIHLDGSFDLDGDNLLEFISLELDPSRMFSLQWSGIMRWTMMDIKLSFGSLMLQKN